MNTAQQDLLQKCEQATRFNVRAHECSVSHGEGPSKGKNPDLGNWGAAGIPAEDLDLNAQRAVLESYQASRHVSNDRPITQLDDNDYPLFQQTVEDKLRDEISLLRKELLTLRDDQNSKELEAESNKIKKRTHIRSDDMRPSTQIALRSYLGKTFQEVS